MQKLFVLGDSISIQYGPYLQTMVEGIFDYSRKEGIEDALQNLDYPTGANGGDSLMVLAYLEEKLPEQDFRPDILLLNCGLHDIKTDPQTRQKQVTFEQYQENLARILKLLKDHQIPLIWVRTTPVDDETHNRKQKEFQRYNEDVFRYNRIADQIVGDAACPIIDLYEFTRKFGAAAYCDHVHFAEQVRELQAAYIAGFLAACHGTV